MQGRLETDIKFNTKTENLLVDMPDCVYEYYVSIVSAMTAKSAYEYISKICAFIRWKCEIPRYISFAGITSEDIGRYLQDKTTKRTRSGGVQKTSPEYQQKIYICLNSFFEYLYQRKLVYNNPMKLIKKTSKSTVIKRVPVEVDEIKRILQAVNFGTFPDGKPLCHPQWKSRDTLILQMFLQTGMREAALREINFSDIDLKNKTLKVMDKGEVEHIYQIEGLIPYIKQWLKDRSVILDGVDTDALFISNRKERMGRATVTTMLDKYSMYVLGRRINPHKLRETFIRLLYEQNPDIYFVCKAVGHKNIATTMRYLDTGDNASERRKSSQIMSQMMI